MKKNIFLTQYKVDLIRLGNNYDGGYLIPKSIIKKTNLLLSFGLGTDWSFEKSFKKMNRSLKINCYDHTINRKFWYEHTLISIFFYIKNFKNFNNIFTFFKYKKFFSQKNVKHIQKKIVSNKFNSHDISIDEITKSFKNKKLFLKMDIEGDEYRIIDKLRYFKKMIGFVIEFHNIDLHHEKISYFLKKNKNFKVVHVSSNNMGGINQNNEPIVVEITFINLKTFSDFKKLKSKFISKNNLDFPNDPQKKDLIL